jgi:uncharacterized protein (TIGR03437 family)
VVSRFILLSLFCVSCFAATYTIQTVAGTNNAGDGGSALAAALGQPEGIAIDKAGNIYFADAAANRVRIIAPDGNIQTFAGTGVAGFAGDGGAASAAQLNQPYGLALDPAGNLYIADLGNGRVRKVTIAGVIETVAGGGALPATNQGQGGPATTAQLMQPRNVTLDANGSLYISDFGANQVYSVAGGTLTLVAGTGVAGFSGDSTSALLAQLTAPAGLAVDPTGALYIADSGNNRVRKVYNGVIITVFNTPGPTGLAFGPPGTLYIAASTYFGSVSQQIPSITSAVDVAVDLAGDLFATSGAFVLEIPAGGTVTTGLVTVIAGSGASPNFGGDNGPATAAQLYSPSSVAMDSSGNWYIADTSNNLIRMVTPAGVISTIAGNGTAGSAGDNGPASAAELNAPRGLAFDSLGNLYIADSGNNEVRKITPAGLIVPVATQLNNPVSVATNAQGSVYIADSGSNQIITVTASGTASIFATIVGPQAVAVDPSGNVLVAGPTQIWTVTPAGVPSTLITGLNSPSGIAVASDGSLLIAATGANLIQQWTTSGSLTTIAGTGTAGFSGDGGPALSAQLNGPAGIGVGANGEFWIADSGNNRIRSLTPSAVTSETAPTATITVVNAASLASGPIAPGEIVTVFGSGFSDTQTQLLLGGSAAKLFYTSPTQINALAPATLSVNSTSMLSVVVNGNTVAESPAPVASAAPGIFTTAAGTGEAAANNQDGSINSVSNPAPRGSVVSFYATGQGSTPGTVVLTVAGYQAQLLYAGPAPGFPGLMQINALIPGGFLGPGIQPVVLTIGGAASQAGVTIAID